MLDIQASETEEILKGLTLGKLGKVPIMAEGQIPSRLAGMSYKTLDEG